MILYVISNFKKNRILSTKVRQLLYIFADRLCRLTASLQRQKHKNYSKIFGNIYAAADHQHKNTGVVHQFTETTVFIAKAVKNILISSFYLLESSLQSGSIKFLNQLFISNHHLLNKHIIIAENCRKLPRLTPFPQVFLYIQNNGSVEHNQAVVLDVLLIYFQRKIKFLHNI